jgi:tRNA-dihydrouridine synthase B
MIGRAAMQHPWVFREIRQYLETGTLPPPPALAEIWAHIREHCAREIARQGSELHAMQSMRTQLMAYSRGMPDAKRLREKFAHVASLAELEDLAAENISTHPAEGLIADAA